MAYSKQEFFPLVTLIVIALLGCTMEIDISIPSFPSIMDYFEATEAKVQSTLSVNFLAFCLAGLLYGPLSESWGRKGLMLFGASCFLVGALGCVFSFSINQLIFWRFIQGLGASSTAVLSFAMIADKYQGDEAAQKISMVNAFSTAFMAMAPVIGGLTIHYFDWRANYSIIALIALVSWGLLIFYLPETKTKKEPLNLRSLVSTYATVTTNTSFMLSALIPNLLVVAYLTFVGSAAFYYINTCELSPLTFAIHQGLLVACFSITSFYAGRIIQWLGSDRAVSFGMLGSSIGAVLMLFFSYQFPIQPYLITAAMCILAIGCALPISITFANSLEIMPDLRGVCSSFIMSTRLLLSGIGVYLTGLMFDGSMRPVAIMVTISVLFAYALSWRLKDSQLKGKAQSI